ncbi:MAG: hypothetical protein QXT25_03140 [Candidatus Anstonellaceae archaeon]
MSIFRKKYNSSDHPETNEKNSRKRFWEFFHFSKKKEPENQFRSDNEEIFCKTTNQQASDENTLQYNKAEEESKFPAKMNNGQSDSLFDSLKESIRCVTSVIVNRTTVKNIAETAIRTTVIVGAVDILVNQSLSNVTKFGQDIAKLIWNNPISSFIALAAVLFTENIVSFIRKSKEFQVPTSESNFLLLSLFDGIKKGIKEAVYGVYKKLFVIGGVFFAAGAIYSSIGSNIIVGFSKAITDVFSVLVVVGKALTSKPGVAILSNLIFLNLSFKKFSTKLSAAAARELDTLLNPLLIKKYDSTQNYSIPSISDQLFNLANKLKMEGTINPPNALQNARKQLLEKIYSDFDKIQNIINDRQNAKMSFHNDLFEIYSNALNLVNEAEEMSQRISSRPTNSERHLGTIAFEMDNLVRQANKYKIKAT